jgi:hypothetical protein
MAPSASVVPLPTYTSMVTGCVYAFADRSNSTSASSSPLSTNSIRMREMDAYLRGG